MRACAPKVGLTGAFDPRLPFYCFCVVGTNHVRFGAPKVDWLRAFAWGRIMELIEIFDFHVLVLDSLDLVFVELKDK